MLFLSLLLSFAVSVRSQWTNRYPKIANMSHHVYLEGYNLPTLNQGATDPAASPDGKTLAIAARGWIWLMDAETREARRLTKSGAIDSRPAWSPDGRQIAFVRDDTKDTSIVLIDAAGGRKKFWLIRPRSTSTRFFRATGAPFLQFGGKRRFGFVARRNCDGREKTLDIRPRAGTSTAAFAGRRAAFIRFKSRFD